MRAIIRRIQRLQQLHHAMANLERSAEPNIAMVIRERRHRRLGQSGPAAGSLPPAMCQDDLGRPLTIAEIIRGRLATRRSRIPADADQGGRQGR